MAYSFQTFSALEVLGATKMNQVEVNIRDHIHGSAGVAAVTNSPRNLIINGEFIGWQRSDFNPIGSALLGFTSTTTPANNDNTVTADRWLLLSNGNNIASVNAENTSVAGNTTGFTTWNDNAIALTIVTANTKFGILQLIPADMCRHVIGQTVTLSFEAKAGASIGNVKAGIVAYDAAGGTGVLTTDIVSAWGADGVTPTLIAGCTFENTPANLSVTTSYVRYSITAAVDTALSNGLVLGVFIWNDDLATTAAQALSIRRVQLEIGSSATDYARRPMAEERLLCKRFCYVVNPYANGYTGAHGWASASTSFKVCIPLEVALFKPPAITVTNQTHWAVTDEVSTINVTADLGLFRTAHPINAIWLTGSVASGLTQFRPYLLIQNSSGAGASKIIIDAELGVTPTV